MNSIKNVLKNPTLKKVVAAMATAGLTTLLAEITKNNTAETPKEVNK